MQRRDFLKLAMGIAGATAAFAATANAAPLSPITPAPVAAPDRGDVEPAVVTRDEVDQLKPTEVRWGHHHHGGWHHRHWHRRHWWHRHHWRRHRR